MATAVILLLVVIAMEVEGIRLDAETRAATSNQMVNVSDSDSLNLFIMELSSVPFSFLFVCVC
jgi:type IV secretory pathway protease TraF